MKFSGSPKAQGIRKEIFNIIKIEIITPKKSFQEKLGANSTFSTFEFNPRGFEDPEICKKSRWIIANKVIMKGTKKWREKNRIKVAEFTEKPPHIQQVNSFPTYGTAWKSLVITLAPQNDICPQGRT